MIMFYRSRTTAGDFKIVPLTNGRWLAMFENENLGSYDSAEKALYDLSGGHSDWPSCGDPSSFNLPDELQDWEVVRVR